VYVYAATITVLARSSGNLSSSTNISLCLACASPSRQTHRTSNDTFSRGQSDHACCTGSTSTCRNIDCSTNVASTGIQQKAATTATRGRSSPCNQRDMPTSTDFTSTYANDDRSATAAACRTRLQHQ
jgi:hypothetical protein